MAFRVPVRQVAESTGVAGTTRDLQEQLQRFFGRLLTVTSGQVLPGSGLRLFKVDDPKTELVTLVSGADNVIPHGLGGKVVKEVFLTPVGGTATASTVTLKDPATLSPPMAAEQVVCLRVSATITARVRVVA